MNLPIKQLAHWLMLVILMCWSAAGKGAELDLAPVPPDTCSATVSSTAAFGASGALFIEAGYRTDDWSGKLRAYKAGEAADPLNPLWDAGVRLDAADWNSRQIITVNPESHRGVPFRFPGDYQ